MRKISLLGISALWLLSINPSQAASSIDSPINFLRQGVPNQSKAAVTYEGAVISDNGKELVIRGTLSSKPVIFISEFKKHRWSSLTPVITLATNIENLSGRHFVSFAKKHSSDGSTNFNGPMISHNIIAFAARLDDAKNGVFYSEKKKGSWHTKVIIQTNDSIDVGKIISLDAPYIYKQNIYFLADIQTKTGKTESGALEFDTQLGKLNVLLFSGGSNPVNYWDMSLNKDSFAIRAEDKETKAQNIYTYDNGKLEPVYSEITLPNEDVDAFSLGGPTYFIQNDFAYVANMVVFKKTSQPKCAAIFSNVLSRHIWVKTGDTINNDKGEIAFSGNPTLSISDTEACIAFEATQADGSSDFLGAYLSCLDLKTDEKPTIYKILKPGDTLDGLGVVERVLLGPVSIRKDKIAVTVKLKSQKYAVVVFKKIAAKSK